MRTERTRILPIFFTQVIGSLPRPTIVRDLINRRDTISTDRHQGLMDEMVIFAIRLQEQADLDVISDGEWRRIHYLDEFLHRVGGHEPVRPFMHQGQQRFGMVVTGRMEYADPVFVKDAEFLVAHTDRCTKFALPSPFLIAVRKWHEDYSTGAYPTTEHYMEHLTEMLTREAQALAQTGVDIIQLDDPALTYFCDRSLTSEGSTHDDRLKREWDIDRQVPGVIAAINQIAGAIPVEVHLHCCHSVSMRQSDVEGDYKPILPFLKDARIDRVNLEFAYRGTGKADDLELLPDALDVGMGVVDVRGERVQTPEEIETIGAAGAAILNPDRIALNPDCGFAPDYGEPPSIDEAFEKLCNLTRAASRLRGRFALSS
jgi:5-methyltetrahydropteroyltriglutamate--homocysteine methyltransferase